jgi:two-component system sensor kinase FixL
MGFQALQKYLIPFLCGAWAAAALMIPVSETIGIAVLAGATCIVLYARFAHRVAQLSLTLQRFRDGDSNARIHPEQQDALARIGHQIDSLLEGVVQERADLRFSEAKIKAVLETATDGIISIDSRGRVESMNSAAERIFGYTKDRVIGQNVSMLMPESFAAQHDHHLNSYLHTGQAKIIGIGREVSGRRSDGAVFPMELAVSELEFGNERSFTGIVRDISARKRTEEQLRLSEEQLHLTVENAPIGIVICDLDCRIMNANLACTKIVGYPRDELLTMRFTDLVRPEERKRCLEFADKAKLGQLENTTIQQHWLHQNRSEVCGVLHIGVIYDDEGVPKMFVIQMEDVTEQRNAEAEARQLRDRIAHVARITTLGEMVAGIAHEINQPLAAIVNYTDASQRLLASGAAHRDDLMHAMKQASDQAHRAAKVLQRLRDFARMRSVPRETVDLNALVKDVVSLANMENPGLRSTITLELDDGLPDLQADPIQIQQVILNLIRNGVDAMQEPGAHGQDLIVRTANEEGESVRIEVVDQGPGVDENASDKLFDPFFSTKQSGMGLGLSICRSIARSHGGQLDFANNANHGATFFLRLPTVRN